MKKKKERKSETRRSAASRPDEIPHPPEDEGYPIGGRLSPTAGDKIRNIFSALVGDWVRNSGVRERLRRNPPTGGESES